MAGTGESRTRFDAGYEYSQMRLMYGSKCFFAGVANPSHPGAIHVINYPFAEERMHEVQIHEAAVTKLELNYEQTLLFSGAEDGSLAVMGISERPKGKPEIK